MSENMIKECTSSHLEQYGKIYAEAFSGEPWNDPWDAKDAEIHIKEIMESKQSYGFEYLIDGKVVGFVLGATMLFHYGRMFEINDLAVMPKYQGKGIATKLMERIIEESKNKGIKGINLITAKAGYLQDFYGKFGFAKEDKVVLMGKEL